MSNMQPLEITLRMIVIDIRSDVRAGDIKPKSVYTDRMMEAFASVLPEKAEIDTRQTENGPIVVDAFTDYKEGWNEYHDTIKKNAGIENV